jgi:hypothetical protein
MSNSGCSIKYNKTKKTKINNYLSILYKDLIQGSKYVNNLDININNSSFSGWEDTRVGRAIFGPSTSNEYLPDVIKKYIIDNSKEMVVFSTKINGKNINLKFSHYEEPVYTQQKLFQYARTVFIIIYLLTLYSPNQCSKNLSITVALSPFKRVLPLNKKDIINPINVNGGYSTIGCLEHSEITIYREEEWLKVLIHELFHNLNLDFANMDIKKWIPLLYSKFGIKSEYNIYETYCETWARILNIVIKSFVPNKTKFISNFYLLMEREQLFSLKQADLILKRFEIPENYIEGTNVFCYYILTASLMNNYLAFFIWCAKNNINLFKFKTTKKAVQSFIDLILSQINSNDFNINLKCAAKFNKQSGNSLRMTIT